VIDFRATELVRRYSAAAMIFPSKFARPLGGLKSASFPFLSRRLIATIALAFLGDRLRLLAAVRSKRAAYTDLHLVNFPFFRRT
jgi:hypothetical protein